MKQNIFLLLISTVFVGLVSQKSYADSFNPDVPGPGDPGKVCCSLNELTEAECCEAGCSYYMKKVKKKANFSGSCGWVSSSSDNDDGGGDMGVTVSGECCLFEDKTDLDGNLTKECCEYTNSSNASFGIDQTSGYKWVDPVCCKVGEYMGLIETGTSTQLVPKKECCEILDPVTVKGVQYKPVWVSTTVAGSAGQDTTGDAGACCSMPDGSYSSDQGRAGSDDNQTSRLFPLGNNPTALGARNPICCQNIGGVWLDGYCCLDQGIQLTCLTVDEAGQQVEVPISGCSQISKDEAQAACEAATSANGDFENGESGPAGPQGGMPENPDG